MPALLTSVSMRPHLAITPSTMRGDAVLVGDVDHEAGDFAAGLLDLPRRFRCDRSPSVDVADGDLGAFLGELDRGRPADALAARR